MKQILQAFAAAILTSCSQPPGQIRAGAFISTSVLLADDAAITGAAVYMGGASAFGNVFLDGTGGSLNVINLICGPNGSCDCTGASRRPCVYGPGVLDARYMGSIIYNGTAAASFTCGGVAAGANCLRLDGTLNGAAITNGAAVAANTRVWCGPFTITPNNLDTAVSSTCATTGLGGFGANVTNVAASIHVP